jgi:hypothetical protein
MYYQINSEEESKSSHPRRIQFLATGERFRSPCYTTRIEEIQKVYVR